MKKAVLLFIIISILFSFGISSAAQDDLGAHNTIDLNNINTDSIDVLVHEVMRKSQVPGASIVLINGSQTKYLSYGYANKENKVAIDKNTCFELGSMSKAFTALGILLLEDEGKLSLNDSVTKYLPWFQVNYKGVYQDRQINQSVDLSLADLLYHTSGFPFKTIGDIPEENSDNSLEKTVRLLNNIYLDFYPGEMYQYASVNYDVLGLIIQTITGQCYEQFMNDRILTPLSLNNTYLFKEEATKNNIVASGYKTTFFEARAYEAPRFRGNTPAGYIFSNAADMERWMRIQLGLIEVPSQLQRIIDKSHTGNTSVPMQNGYCYAAGWNVNEGLTEIQHGGSNPNYSSMIMLKPDKDLAICVLTNLNSNAAGFLALNLLNIVQDKSVTSYAMDVYQILDIVFSVMLILAVLLVGLISILLMRLVIKLMQKKQKFFKPKALQIICRLLLFIILVFIASIFYYIPNIIFMGLSWRAANLWGSFTIMPASFLWLFFFIILAVYMLLTTFVKNTNSPEYNN